MDDKELTELAARAVGITIQYNSIGTQDARCQWKPLEDDGAAFRLAVKLRMHIEPARMMGGDFVEVHAHPSGRGDCAGAAPLGDDDDAATRRAIVEAAAALVTPNAELRGDGPASPARRPA